MSASSSAPKCFVANESIRGMAQGIDLSRVSYVELSGRNFSRDPDVDVNTAQRISDPKAIAEIVTAFRASSRAGQIAFEPINTTHDAVIVHFRSGESRSFAVDRGKLLEEHEPSVEQALSSYWLLEKEQVKIEAREEQRIEQEIRNLFESGTVD